MELWTMLYRATQDGWVMVESSDKMWSTGEGNGKPLQYSCHEQYESMTWKVTSHIWKGCKLLIFRVADSHYSFWNPKTGNEWSRAYSCSLGSHWSHSTNISVNASRAPKVLYFAWILLLTPCENYSDKPIHVLSNFIIPVVRLVVSYCLCPHELQHPRFPCPSPSPGVCSNSCPLSQWYHPTIPPPVVSFSSAFNLSQHQGLFQGASSYRVAKASVLPMNI